MKKALRNAVWVTTADAGTRVIGFVVTAFLARVLSPDYFGVMSIGLAVLGYLSQVSGAGLQVVETRNVAAGAVRDDSRVGAVVLLRGILAAGVITAAVGIIHGLPLATDMRDSLVLSALIVLPLALSLDWLFQGKEEFASLSVARLANAAVYAAVVFVLVRTPEDFRTAILAVGAGALAGAVVLLSLHIGAGGAFRLSIDRSLWKELLRQGIPVGAALLIAQSAVNLGPIVLGVFETTADAGVFSAGLRIIVALLIADRVLNSLFLPYLSRIRATRPEEFDSVVSIAFRAVAGAAMPVAVVVFLTAPLVTGLVFGAGYEAASDHLRFLLPYFVLTLLNSVVTCALIASGKEQEFSRFQSLGSSVLVVAVILLVAGAGPAGAGLGITCGEIVILFLLMNLLKKTNGILLAGTLMKFLGAVLCTGLLIYFGGAIDMMLLIPLSVVVVVTMSFLTGAIRRTDLRFLWGRFI